MNTVCSSSNDSLAFPKTFLRHRFTDPTMRSKYPPHHGERGKLNFHFVLFCARNSRNVWSLASFFNNLFAALKVLALSVFMSLGVPPLEQNLLNAFIKVDVCKSSFNSKWVTLVAQHVNNVIYTFFIFPWQSLTNNGPAKSMPTLLKGTDIVTLKSGSGAIFGAESAFDSSHLHFKHLRITLLTCCLPLGTQNLDLSSASLKRSLLWATLLWQSSITRSVNLWSLGKMTGHLLFMSKSAFCNRPLHTRTPFCSTIPSCVDRVWKSCLHLNVSWTSLIQTCSAASIWAVLKLSTLISLLSLFLSGCLWILRRMLSLLKASPGFHAYLSPLCYSPLL